MEIAGFTEISLLLKSGIYILTWKDEIVYVGQSVKPAARIATHIAQKGKQRAQSAPGRKKLPSMRFDGVHIMHCALSDLDRIEKELIDKYKPRYNISQNPPPTISLETLLGLMPVPLIAPVMDVEPRSSWRRF